MLLLWEWYVATPYHTMGIHGFWAYHNVYDVAFSYAWLPDSVVGAASQASDWIFRIMSFDFARFARCSPDKNGFVDFPHSRGEFFDFSPFAKYSICDTSSICTESDSICFASSVDICKERRVQEHTDCSSCTIDADASQTTEATEDESVLHHPVLSVAKLVYLIVSSPSMCIGTWGSLNQSV